MNDGPIAVAADGEGALRGRLVVLTGGGSGIGQAMVRELSTLDATVHEGSRRALPQVSHHHSLDLASLASVRTFADQILALGRPIDLLVLNAGVHVPWRTVTTGDGHELHWQVNYLSNFVLTHLLLDRCKASGLKRIVYVASEAHRMAGVYAGPLTGFWRHYARSKEAATSFFLRLQDLHPDLRVEIVAPGYVATPIHRHKSAAAAWLERATSRVRSPADVAREIMGVITSSGPRSAYWDRGTPAPASRRARDVGRGEVLWRESLASVRELLPDAVPCVRITNFSRTWHGFGAELARPAHVEGLAALVRAAAASGRELRMVGRTHSYNDVYFSRTAMISNASLDRIVGLDAGKGTFTCQGGVTVDAICAFLDQRGFALRFSGNNGQQTIAGALATGTHGYGRDGGLMSELVTAMTVMGPDGQLTRFTEEADLRALRLGLGTLGVVVEVTMAVIPANPCLSRIASLPRQEFIARLDELAAAHEYLRFMDHPFDRTSILYLTIDQATDAPGSSGPVRYTGSPAGGAAWLVIPWLRMPAIRQALGRVVGVGGLGVSFTVPFSTSLFVRDGVLHRKNAGEEWLRRVGLRALNRNDWLNMELAIPRHRFAAFAQLFAERLPRQSGFATTHPYYVCRVVGSAQNVLLGPNHGRDVVYVDIHMDPLAPTSDRFLRTIEAECLATMSARPHWGKVSFAGREAIRDAYPAASIDGFLAAKRRLDPQGVFSNDYTRRVLGV